MVMILASVTVKRHSYLMLPWITPRAMQVTAGLITFQPVFGAKNAQLNHLYGSIITLRQWEEKCLCLVALVKEHLSKIKDREKRSEKLFLTSNMFPTTAISNVTIASWIKVRPTLTIIRPQGVQIQRPLHPLLPARKPQ